ncbi:MAG: hypothetical protein LBV38_06265 [Alistipes sp.]|nr:hypothetical protein [Alistipes sp.]
MKRTLFYFVVTAMTTALFAGCGDVVYPIWDFPPSNIGLIVRTSEWDGDNNLLDPDFDGNILGNEIVAEYNGKEYPLGFIDAKTRYIPASWRGLRVGKYYGYDGDDGTTALLFGEFQTETHESSHPETFTIDWGDGTSDEVKFDLYVTYSKKGKEANVHRSIWLNGELQSDNSLVVEIVK